MRNLKKLEFNRRYGPRRLLGCFWFISIGVILLGCGSAMANDVIAGPFYSGIGNWTTLPNGGFEVGDTSEWFDGSSPLGVFMASDERAAVGQYSAAAVPSQSFQGPGFGLCQWVLVQEGQQYVLSGFFHTGGLSGGALYLDLGDVPFEPYVSATIGVPEWQFAWSTFTVPPGVGQVEVRLVRDSWIGNLDDFVAFGERGYIDEVAVTPINEFTPPMALTADAGSYQAITWPDNTINLDGTVTAPEWVPITTTWSKVSGPGTVTFGDAGAIDTTATFSEAGLYVLRLTVDDGEQSAYDEVVVRVKAEGAGDLVGHWKLDETSGSAASDSTGNGYDGTLYNMDDSDWIGGIVDGALEFDGFNDYVEIPAFNLNSNTVTISAWIKRDGVQEGTYTGIVVSRDGSTIAGLSFGKGPGGWEDINHELAYNWNDDPAAWDWHSGLFIPDNKWVFVALVVEPTKATLYLVEDGTLSSATHVLDHDIEEFDGATFIASDCLWDRRFFRGTIDDVRIYDRTLSDLEVAILGNASVLPPPVTMTASYTATAETELGGTTVVVNGPAYNEGTSMGGSPSGYPAHASSSVSLETTNGGHLQGVIQLTGMEGFEEWWDCVEWDPQTGECLWWDIVPGNPIPCGDARGTVAGTVDLGISEFYPVGSELELALEIIIDGYTGAAEDYHLQLWRDTILLGQIDPASPDGIAIPVFAGETLAFELFASENSPGSYSAFSRDFEFQMILHRPPVIESLGDLVITAVDVQGTPVAGRPLHVAWDVLNDDPENTAGAGFVDAVYLSSDTQWDIGDIHLMSVLHEESVGPQQGYHAEVDVIMPGIMPGDYYILVRTDLSNRVEELDGEDNNVTASELIFVDMEELAVGTMLTDSFTETELARYFRVDAVRNKDLKIHLDDLDDMGANELYVSFEAIPTRSKYDYCYAANFEPDQAVIIPNTQAGTYYVLAYADSIPSGGLSTFSVAAEYLPMEIISIMPDRSGNTEFSNPEVAIEGVGFDANATVLLRREGQTDITATNVRWVDTSTIFAQFDLLGTAAGLWALVVVNPDSQTSSCPFTVVEGGMPQLETRLILPSALGYHRHATIWIEYVNTGDAPMPVPLLKLHGSEDALLTADQSLSGPGLWTDNPPAGLTDIVQVLAIGSGADPGVLNPGDSGLIPVYYRGCKLPWDWSYPPIEFNLGVLEAGDTTPIDWVEVEAQVRPYDIETDLWEAIWPQIKAQIGTTWGDYLQVLINNTKYLAENGRRTHVVRELFALEITKATGAFIPPRTLSSTVDAYCPGPGLPLVFERTTVDTITQRFNTGPFGRGGWSHNFEYSLKRPDEFTAVVEGPGGTKRTFTRYPEGKWRAAPGDYSTLEQMSDGTYELREKDGLTWLFDSTGRLVGMKEPNGNRVTLNYAGGNLSSISHSNGQGFVLEYNTDGRIERLTDHAGRQTQYVYDTTGEHLINVIAPGNRVTAYEYNPTTGGPADHALTTITFPDGTHVYYAYNELGQLTVQWRDTGAERVEFNYEDFETVIVRDACNAETTLNYGLPGQLRNIVNPLGNSVSFQYEPDFSFAGITAPDGASYEPTYDNIGNLVKIQDPLGHSISMGYATNYNRLAWLVDQNGNRIDFTTDANGNLTGITYPDSSTETFEYDDAGNVISYTNRRGQTVTYTYNSLGRLTSKDYADTLGVIDYQYTYDTAGNLTSATDASGTITITYDPNTDWMTRIEYPGGHFFEFEYDNLARRAKRTDQDDNIVNYIYDAIGRLDRMTNGSDVLIVDYDYDASGRPIRKTLGNGVYTTYEYDAAGQLTHLVNYKSDDTVVSRFDYTYNENGNRTSMTTLDGTYSYGYDLLGQLIGVTYPDGHIVTYRYDAAGNRIEVVDNSVTTDYATNNMNQYTNVGGITYTYDADGNMKTKTEGGVTTTYTYDIENRLIGVSTPTDTWTYTYDAFGNRTTSTHNGVKISYVIDPIGFSNIAAEYDDTGNLIARYDHGFGLLSRTDPTNVPAYYTFDALGSTSEVIDPAGLVLNSYTYDPFGISLGKSEILANPFQYIGEYGVINETNGLIFMRTRQYCSRTGRFTSVDPLLMRAANTYTYVRNNPLVYIDPKGLQYLPPQLVQPVTEFGQGFIVGFTKGFLDEPYVSYSYSLWEVAGSKVGELAGRAARWLWERGLEASEEAIEAHTQFAEELERMLKQDQLPGLNWEFGYSVVPPSDLPTDPADTGASGSVGTLDPNKKLGPRGFGSGGYIAADPSDGPMVYTVYFENEPNATAAALKVKIVDQLDEDLDWTTFELLEIGFEHHQVIVPSGMTHHEEQLEIDGWTWNAEQGWHTGETPLVVDVDADIDVATGLVTWQFVARDPDTGWEPEDAYAGFLPPDDANDISHRGEGYVTYLIRRKPNLPTGTQITNTASIYFDANPPIETPEVLNTVDAGAPSSHVLPLPTFTTENDFLVEWTGQDDISGSGIAHYDVYVSVDESPFALWLSTADTSAIMNGEVGHTYAFYSIAYDNVEHIEDVPALPDAVTIITEVEFPIAAVTYDGDLLLSTGGATTVNASLIATLRDDMGNPLDIDGEEVTFTLTAEGVGTIVETASSIDGVANAVMALEPAIYMIEVTLASSDFTASAILVVYNPEGGFATGGGWIVPEDDGLNTHAGVRANFGFNAKYKQDNPTGHIEFRYSDGYIDLKSTSIEQLVITGGKIVQFKGWALVNGAGDNWFFVKAIDNGEPGTNDTFEIKVWYPGISEEVDSSERAGGVLQGGNIVVHAK